MRGPLFRQARSTAVRIHEGDLIPCVRSQRDQVTDAYRQSSWIKTIVQNVRFQDFRIRSLDLRQPTGIIEKKHSI